MSKLAVLHGTPGSGKTTHAQKLQELHPHSVHHISIGNRLRSIRLGEEESRYKGEIDAQAEILAQSQPLDHEVVNGVIFEFVEQCPSLGVVLIDGYPRFVEQLQYFYKSLELERHLYLGIVHFHITEATSISRLTRRGSRSGEREVDVDFAAWRFNEYKTRTLPTIALLGINSQLVEINAEPSIDEVWGVFYEEAQELLFS